MRLEKIITVDGLYKRFGDLTAVNGVSFYVPKGSLFAFLGPNGAGKSTTINILCTLLKPDAGKVTVAGYQLSRQDDEIRRQIGVVFQEGVLDPLLSVEENLETRGSLYGLGGKQLREAIGHAAEAAEVTSFLKRPYGKLSGGQRRRADIARALVHTPSVLFLDEPTTGLDPQTRKSVWDTVERLQREKNMTVFLTTHYMEEAAKANYVCVIDEGKLSAQGSPAELREKYSSDTLKIKATDQAAALNALKRLDRSYTCENGMIKIPLSKTVDAIELLDELRPWIEIFEVSCGSMDEAFIAITGKKEARE